MSDLNEQLGRAALAVVLDRVAELAQTVALYQGQISHEESAACLDDIADHVLYCQEVLERG